MKPVSMYVVTVKDDFPNSYIAGIYPTRAKARSSVAWYKADPFTVTVKCNRIDVSTDAAKVLMV